MRFFYDHHPIVARRPPSRSLRIFFFFLISLALLFSVWTLLFGVHALLMTAYDYILLVSQGPIIFDNLTTNEQFNGWRYKYMRRDPNDPTGRKMLTPFSEGRLKNCLAFFHLRRSKEVRPTVEMAQSADVAHENNSGGGQQLPESFDWDGIEHLQRGYIVTPENEGMALSVFRYLNFQDAMRRQQEAAKNQLSNDGTNNRTLAGHAHSHGHGHSHGASYGGAHGHSHGGESQSSKGKRMLQITQTESYWYESSSSFH